MAHDHFYGICENKCLVEIEHGNIPGVVPVEKGGTGATTASAAIANLHGVESTTADITYYVSPSGSDSNSGTSASKPFKTLAYALSKLPKYIAHNITVNLASGTYTEANVAISNFTGPGKIVINGNTNSATSYYFEDGISVKYISCELNINGVSFGTASIDSGIDCMYCSGVITMNKCHAYEPSLTDSNVIGFYVRACSSVLFYECKATYFSRGFYSDRNSQVFCSSCVCTNCTHPWNSYESSILFVSNCSESGHATTASYSNAGLIVNTAGGVIG